MKSFFSADGIRGFRYHYTISILLVQEIPLSAWKRGKTGTFSAKAIKPLAAFLSESGDSFDQLV